jgi:hypothetical protein
MKTIVSTQRANKTTLTGVAWISTFVATALAPLS